MKKIKNILYVKNCPFCSSSIVELCHMNAWWVRCGSLRCASSGPVRANKQAAIKAWEKRFDDDDYTMSELIEI